MGTRKTATRKKEQSNMVVDLNDPMAVLDEEMQRAQAQTGGFAPFFFSIKDGEKALVRPLLNMREYVMLNFHELYNPATKKYEVSAVCAVSFDRECQHCVDAVNHPDKKLGKKLSAHRRFYLPIYIHSALKKDSVTQKWAPLTYTDQDGNEQDVKGVRILEMKASSSILASLVASYNEAEGHDITKFDFRIERKGTGTDTEYTTTLSPNAPRALPDDLKSQRREQIKSDVEIARPMKVVGGAPVVAQSNGKAVEDDIPSF